MPKDLEQKFIEGLEEYGLEYKQPSFAPQNSVSSAHAPGVPVETRDKVVTDHFSPQTTPNVPKIMVQSPSPKQMPISRKRAPSLTTEQLYGPPLARARAEHSTGLPALPIESEALWKFKFPGNTHALMTILLTWSCTIMSCYKRYPKLAFPVNPAFPYPITPPIYEQLISISLYDTSVQPHKEIRFLGPGDAAEMIYGEVDTFRSERDLDAFQAQQKPDCKVQRAATGEGRWAYLLIKGYQATKEETPPHFMIAFHVSAVTDSSDCLHTIFPDAHSAPSTLYPPLLDTPLTRFSSLHNLIRDSHGPSSIHKALRSASSSEQAQGGIADIAAQEGAQTLRRTVLKLDKAGSVPLIEGYRVDVQAFKGWLDAVGKGAGKLVIWRGKE
ncbi:uncharacterized protein K460DRAFT_311648 [Cucurbitaria berberidis CBS 394.84]|uniref:Uncharacterized protein n=1 Tax=Cucurbitaria berberidis CBS 394.84 TaxID=1168544 RepID=A0A9P4GHI9_9PLEO|nr:uncharacterized protein K460DRAFT_311648 [Cucurbitaria berberidis CBS 394.84]KAF1845349.1 hypothetical protein K460DRAFT_311648 [Cucurbitaria berberidis CBS 394.84]